MPYSPLLAGRVVAAAEDTTAVVGTFHILPHGRLSAVGTRALGALLRRNKKRFDAFLSVSSAAKSFASSHFGIQSSVLPNVVALESYKKGKPLHSLLGKQNIVFLGRFVERKGAHHVLAAYKILLASHPELRETTRLVLCGDGPDRQRLENQAKDIRDRGGDVVFTGFLPEDEKKNYLASATIAVFPSTGGESFGIVLIEAMAAGSMVVLGGDNDGYTTVLGDEPMSLFVPSEHDVFAQRLYVFLTDEAKRQALHTAQQKTVTTYDIEHVGPKLIAVYSAALARRAHKRNT
jgi:phosphatidylinositol alpha-mannosyltransferase